MKDRLVFFVADGFIYKSRESTKRKLERMNAFKNKTEYATLKHFRKRFIEYSNI